MFNQLGAFADLIKNAGKIREAAEKAVESLGQVVVEGESGGGVVKVKANGRLEIISVRIADQLAADLDRELLEDLIAAAVNSALVRAREAAAESLSTLAGPLPPGLFPGLGPLADPSRGSP